MTVTIFNKKVFQESDRSVLLPHLFNISRIEPAIGLTETEFTRLVWNIPGLHARLLPAKDLSFTGNVTKSLGWTGDARS